MFTDEQKRALAADLDKANVRARTQSGRQLSYVEGWHAIAEANRIFGFDGWTRETVDIRCVSERERKIGKEPNQRDGWGVSYVTKVKVIAFAGDTLVTREGVGAGHGIDVDLGQAHESAIKEAETDAMKRALMTFGNPFGLALYDKEQAHVSSGNGNGAEPPRSTSRIPPDARVTTGNSATVLATLRKTMAMANTAEDLSEWFSAGSTKHALELLSDPDYQTMKAEYQQKKKALGQAANMGAG